METVTIAMSPRPAKKMSSTERSFRVASGQKFLVPVCANDGIDLVPGGLIWEVPLISAALSMDEAKKIYRFIHTRYAIPPSCPIGFAWATVCPPGDTPDPTKPCVLIEGILWHGKIEFALLETPMLNATIAGSRERLRLIRSRRTTELSMFLFASLSPVQLCKCDDCSYTCDKTELSEVRDLERRLDFPIGHPDRIEPDGECPKCGALSYELDSRTDNPQTPQGVSDGMVVTG